MAIPAVHDRRDEKGAGLEKTGTASPLVAESVHPDDAAAPRLRAVPVGRILANQQVLLVLVLVAMVAAFSLLNPTFFSVPVFGNVLVSWAPVALLAIGETFVVIGGGIDLSVGSTLTVSGVIGAFAMAAATAHGVADPLSILLGVGVSAGVGLTVGLLNAALINVARLVPFIATLATLGAGSGLALVLTHGGPVGGGPASAIGLSVPWLGPLSWPDSAGWSRSSRSAPARRRPAPVSS
ncbi:Inner membrane ABC transporter permease protein YtfT [Frondihabitans sp. 762G35]|uniref:ABC transporter permease n=1 Tax=Frondihabitans sp. 762G35 TaxID=1446794 RepID=UPI000D22A479|nr:ABC transporter permease [Frondihabitans sp. 762G35]ARC58538.1 Inner membrane ABC transporter permease protein YtfT [Frondihabitans sp. 762G35]